MKEPEPGTFFTVELERKAEAEVDDGGEYAFIVTLVRDGDRWYDYGCAVSADDANGAVVKVLRAANSRLGEPVCCGHVGCAGSGCGD